MLVLAVNVGEGKARVEMELRLKGGEGEEVEVLERLFDVGEEVGIDEWVVGRRFQGKMREEGIVGWVLEFRRTS